VVQPVYAGGRIANGNKLASLGLDAGEYQTQLSRNEVLLKTEEQYWLLVSLDEKLKTIGKFEALLDSLLRRVEDGFASGLVMKNDVLKVKIKRSEVLMNKSKVENGRKLAAMAFCASAQTRWAGHHAWRSQAWSEVRQRLSRRGPSMASTTSRIDAPRLRRGSSKPPVLPRCETTNPARVRFWRTFERNCSGHSAATASSARLVRVPGARLAK